MEDQNENSTRSSESQSLESHDEGGQENHDDALEKLIAERDKWKALARKNEDQAKRNSTAATELAKQQAAAKTESERITALEQALEDERKARFKVEESKKRSDFASQKGVPASALVGRDESEWDSVATDLLEWRNGRAGRSEWAGSGDPGKKLASYDGYQRAIDELKRKNQA